MKSLAVVVVALFLGVAEAQAQCQDCAREPDGSGQMCWSGVPDGPLGDCWEEPSYDQNGNELGDRCVFTTMCSAGDGTGGSGGTYTDRDSDGRIDDECNDWYEDWFYCPWNCTWSECQGL
jgi:hypothetical protein